MNSGEIAHPLTLAAERLDDLDPEFVARVRDELQAGPHTTERIREAVNALAGLPAGSIPIVVSEIDKVDGYWFGGGQYAGRYVAFPLHPDQAPAMLAVLDTGETVTAMIPAADIL